MTNWLTGRRMIWIDVPKVPLPRQLGMGPFRASIYHKEQKERQEKAQTCNNCMETLKVCKRFREKGHIAKDCPLGETREIEAGESNLKSEPGQEEEAGVDSKELGNGGNVNSPEAKKRIDNISPHKKGNRQSRRAREKSGAGDTTLNKFLIFDKLSSRKKKKK